jgi:putative solute:sodium symporter small subunit
MKESPLSETNRRAYWRQNLTIVAALLSVWFVVSFVVSIIFVDSLNDIRIGSFRLGFWMAQQGSLYVFVVLIFVYVWLMNRLDRAYGVEEPEAEDTGAAR